MYEWAKVTRIYQIQVISQFIERQKRSFWRSSLALKPSPFSFAFHSSSIFTIDPRTALLYRFSWPSGKSSMRSSKSIWLMEGKLEMKNFSSLPISFMEPAPFWNLLVISLRENCGCSSCLILFSEMGSGLLVAEVVGRGFSSMTLYLISQFFWMQEQNLFLILFSGLPGRCLLISDHFLPSSEQSSIIFLSYSSVQSSFLILGSSLLMNLSRICLPVLLPSISESSFQFLPIFFMSFFTVSSSSADQIFLWAPSWLSLRQRCRHWFSLRSFMSSEMTAHFLGYSLYRLMSC